MQRHDITVLGSLGITNTEISCSWNAICIGKVLSSTLGPVEGAMWLAGQGSSC